MNHITTVCAADARSEPCAQCCGTWPLVEGVFHEGAVGCLWCDVFAVLVAVNSPFTFAWQTPNIGVLRTAEPLYEAIQPSDPRRPDVQFGPGPGYHPDWQAMSATARETIGHGSGVPVHQFIAQFLTEHWAGGIGIPADYRERSPMEQCHAIREAQAKGVSWQRCAYLAIAEQHGVFQAMLWVSGSRRGGILIDGRGMRPWLVLADCGTSEDLRAWEALAQRLGIGSSRITVHATSTTQPWPGEAWVDAQTVLTQAHYTAGMARPSVRGLWEEDLP